jgi:integrase/recombinase XerD
MKQIDITLLKVDGKERFALTFPYDKELIKVIKTIPGICWSRNHLCWHMARTQANLNRLVKEAGSIAIINRAGMKKIFDHGREDSLFILDQLAPLDEDNLKKLFEYMRFKRYSETTIRTYTQILSTYLRFRDPGAEEVSLQDEVVRFTNAYIRPKMLSYSYQNQFINALKLFHREILHTVPELETIQRPRMEHRLPNVLSKEEVQQILRAMKNLKHRAMLSLIYGCGLRRGELLSLKPENIDSNRLLLIIKMGKGRKDRVVPLSQKLIDLLRVYYREYRPQVWLFEGVKKGDKYDDRSLQMVLKKAIYLSGIKKKVTLHWLRHSYATHLHESGVDIHMIQLILGHKDTRTTEIYTHVSKKSIQRIRSPFDDL